METNKEKLTQPVGVEPDSYEIWVNWDYPSHWDSCDKEAYDRTAENDRRVIYSAETVARLIAERDAQQREWSKAYDIGVMAKHERDALKEQVRVLRSLVKDSYREGWYDKGTYNDSAVTDIDEQWNESAARHVIAATEPK